jgi:peroxiredoxin
LENRFFKEKKMTRRTTLFLTVGLIVSLLAVGISYAGSGCCDKSKEQSQNKAASDPKAPLFTLTNYDGKEVSLADFEGKIVVLEWLNYDCPFVKYHYETASTMVDLANKYAEKGVVWLAINSTNYATAETNKAFAQKDSIPYPILDDHKGNVGHAYGAERTPELFVIDRGGQIAYHGAIDNAPLGKLSEGQTEKINYVDNALTELLAGKDVTVPETKPYGCTVKYAK